ncbi:MAG: transglycosylase domain-containing protein [Ichthyobacteriaceae bacterium]|nr:transglycosylase domain-containing protein [Ichthyobacteriaceae bacterium]
MRKFFVKFITYTSLIVGVTIISLYIAVMNDVFGHIPSKEELKDLKLNLASEIWSSDKKLIGKTYIQNRTRSKFSNYPDYLVNALVATEDNRFYEHNGVDYISLMRVAVKTLIMQNKRSGGGSTITQQVTKNYYGRSSYGPLTTLITKVKEHILASRLEENYDKEEIIELYLNTVPFGEGVYGIQSAAKRYFSKDVKDLKIEEAAVLIGMLKANTAYNPRLHPKRSKQRRNTVLSQMFKGAYISYNQLETLKKKELKINYNSKQKYNPTGYFNRRVNNEATNILSKLKKSNGKSYNIKTDGLKIKTTLNYSMQIKAESALLGHLIHQQKKFDKQWYGLKKTKKYKTIINHEVKNSSQYKSFDNKTRKKQLSKKKKTLVFDYKKYVVKNLTVRDSIEHYLKMVQGAVVAINPNTGAVLSYVGGKNSKIMPYDLVNAERQMASTFKPFVFATAIKQGWKPCDYIDNDMKKYSDYNNWTPKNSNGKYGGKYSMKGALTNSVNVASVETYIRAGREHVNDLVNDVGLIDYNLSKYPSVALGIESSSLLKMVSAYDIFAVNGKHHKPYLIESITDKNGKIIYKHKAKKPVVILSKHEQELMATMLRSVIDNGTGKSLKSKYHIKSQFGGKTGTAQNFSDAWFIAFNPKIVIGVWSGFNNPNIHFQSSDGYGSKASLPVFAKMINMMDKDSKLHKYTQATFPKTSAKTISELNCKDYRDDNFIERTFENNDSNTTTKDEKEKQRKTKKRRFWKRLFGG